MFYRYFTRLLGADGTPIYSPPFPLDSGNLSLLVAALTSDIQPGQRVLVDTFAVDDVYPDAFTRLAGTTRTAADVGKVYAQASDNSYWTLTGVAPIAYTLLIPAAPALPGGAALGPNDTPPGFVPFGAVATAGAVTTYTPNLYDSGGGAGDNGWNDAADFPTAPLPMFLHRGASASYAVILPAAGSYVVTGDAIEGPGLGTCHVSFGGVNGPDYNFGTGANRFTLGIALGTFNLPAGLNPFTVNLLPATGQYWGIKRYTFTKQ